MAVPLKLIIFDLDGTLVDAYTAVHLSMNFTLQRLGYPAQDFMTVKNSVGWGEKHLLSCFVRSKDIDAAQVLFKKHHRQTLLKHVRLLDHAGKTLAQLKKQGCTLAVASNRPTRFTLLILKHLAIRPLFSSVVCADQVKRPKPAGDVLTAILRKLKHKPSEALYVGDMPIDIQAGKKAKVRTVAVTTGSGRIKDIKKENPFLLLKNLKQLSRILKAELQNKVVD